ncbi:protein-disulfide reductase DsbD domain-containing protein [Ancylobacter crimeensis]|nr:protein-disulfide reductase DsbD domain-containing protein [Ancylobacter crimeensis]
MMCSRSSLLRTRSPGPALRLVAGFVGLLLLPSAALAGAESDWVSSGGGAVRLVAGATAGGALDAGVEIRLQPGWKTYWRYPGDSGVPPRFDWSGSENLASVAVKWPAPHRFDDGGGSYSIGYKRDLVLPLVVTPKDPARKLALKLTLDFAVCEKICQPARAELALDVPAGGAAPSNPELVAAQASVPAQAALGAAGPTGIGRVQMTEDDGVPVLRIEARTAHAESADLFVEGPNEDWALPLPIRSAGPDGTTLFTVPIDGVPKGADIAKTPLRLTLVDGERAVEVEATPSR